MCRSVSPLGSLKQLGNGQCLCRGHTEDVLLTNKKNRNRWGWEEGFAFQLQALAIIILPLPFVAFPCISISYVDLLGVFEC